MSGNTNIGTAYLKVVGEVDKGTANKISKEMESAGTQGGNAFTSAFSKFGKKLVGAFSAYEIGKKIGETIFNAAAAYANFEQLKGGVEKIFDQADQAKILRDAKNAYLDLNLSVNEYLSAINQVGATFAQTMGDQKGYDVARKGMKAIADYSSGTGRNLEELNQKYGLIIRSAASYQSIADQFSGILPATSKDFLAQAQAAGFLSDKYKQLTEVPIAEYQEAVTNMLERGVDQMGLLGNTAAETEHTLSGSIAGMKSAWENFLIALGDPEGNIEEAMGDLLGSIDAVAANVIPIVGQIIGELIVRLPEMIEQLAPVLVEAIVRLILKVGETIQKGLDSIFTDLGNWVADLVNGTEEAGDQMALATAEGVDQSVAEVKRLPAETEQALSGLDYTSSGRALGDTFAEGIRRSIANVQSAAYSLVSAADAYMPHSPAKEGPFSGRGWTLYSGMSIAEGLGEGFKRGIADAQRDIVSGMGALSATINNGSTYNVNMSVTADSTTTLDNLVAQARRARALNGGW